MLKKQKRFKSVQQGILHVYKAHKRDEFLKIQQSGNYPGCNITVPARSFKKEKKVHKIYMNFVN